MPDGWTPGHFNLQYGIVANNEPWCAKFATSGVFQIVIVRRGSCWFDCPDHLAEPLLVAEGGIVVTTVDATQIWRGSRTASIHAATDAFDFMPLDDVQDDDVAIKLLVGRCALESKPSLLALPAAFYVPPADVDAIAPMLDLIEAETLREGDAAERAEIVRRASEIITIILSRFVARQRQDQGLCRQDRTFDPKVLRAIKLIETESAKEWTVESLAAAVGMGRSAFAARFRELVGDTPVNCLFKTRMRLASQMIREGGRSLARIAESIGYQSESSFIKAFVRHFGVTPGQFRSAGTPPSLDRAFQANIQ